MPAASPLRCGPRSEPGQKTLRDEMRSQKHRFCSIERAKPRFPGERPRGQHGTLTRVWAERGTRPRAPRDTRYKSAYIFGAVCPARAETAALLMPHADTRAMNAHLAEISRPVAPGAHAVVHRA